MTTEILPAPELRVPEWYDVDHRPVPPITLAGLETPLVYLFCFQAWCPGCHSHGFPSLVAARSAMADRGLADSVSFVVVHTVFEGHDQNTSERAVESMQQHGLTDLPVGHDSGEPPHTMADYRTGGTPWTVLIGAPDDRPGERPVLAAGFQADPEVVVPAMERLLAPDRSEPRGE